MIGAHPIVHDVTTRTITLPTGPGHKDIQNINNYSNKWKGDREKLCGNN